MKKEEIRNESKVALRFKKNFTIKAISINAIIAALYAVVTIICGPLAYEFAQFRFSEILNLMVFFNPTYTIGLTILIASMSVYIIHYKRNKRINPISSLNQNKALK